MPEDFDYGTFGVDHIIARKHGGPTVSENLYLSCYYCNTFKGSDIATLDPKFRRLTPLFNPRRQLWSRHFQWDDALIVGRTAAGRATILLLRINDPFRVRLRETLIDEGMFPPR